MNLKEINKESPAFDNNDKSNLVKAILPADYTYNRTTQELTITGPLEEVQLDAMKFTQDKTRVDLLFSSSKTGKKQDYRVFINSPYKEGASSKAELAVFIKLRQTVETYLGRSLTDEDLNIDIKDNSFEELVASMLNKLQLPTKPIGFLLAEFKDPEAVYMNVNIFNGKGAFISNKKENLDLSLLVKPTMKFIVDEEPIVSGGGTVDDHLPF